VYRYLNLAHSLLYIEAKGGKGANGDSEDTADLKGIIQRGIVTAGEASFPTLTPFLTPFLSSIE
jgi:hypothetical protein